jgi:DNA invertase Pin-like site-specific DNA recombinase
MAKARRAAIYVRISKDRTGEGAGVTRQEEDCRALAKKRRLQVVQVFVDNDTSAYSKKPRPGYEALLNAIQAKAVQAVIVWHVDRLYRRMHDLERYIDVCQPNDVPTFPVQSSPIDLTTPAGRLGARTLGSFAQYESEQKAERQRRANLQRAQQGKNFATKRCFGFEPGNVTLRAAEADPIRDAYQALLDGSTVAAIARRWNAAGLATPQSGNPWDGSTVSQLMRGPRMGGMRVYQGKIVTGSDGQPVCAEYPGIVDQDTWHAAQSILRDPSRSFPSGPKLLLSGIAVCGICGSKMLSGGTRNGRRRIRCSQFMGHVYRESEPIEELVVRVVLGYLARPDIKSQLLHSPEEDRHQVTQIRKALADLQQRADAIVAGFVEGTINEFQYRDALKRFARQRSELEAQMPQSSGTAARRLADAPDPSRLWDELDPDEKRRVIDELVEVRVLPTGTKEATYLDWRRRILNPDTVRIEWRSMPLRP